MKIITSNNEYWDTLIDHVCNHRITSVSIATYGIYMRTLPFMGKGRRPSGARSFFDELVKRKIRVRILIGTTNNPDYVWHNADHLNGIRNVSVKVAEKSHTKGVAFSDGWCMIGGRNLTDSDYTDLSVWIKSASISSAIRRAVLGVERYKSEQSNNV